MRRLLCGMAALALLLGSVGQARAGLIYDNGPIAGNFGYGFSGGESISDSFIVSSTTTLGSIQAGLWATAVDGPPTSISWAIGTSPGASDVSSGTATPTNTFVEAENPYLIYESVFAASGTVGPGTYFLTLSNGFPFGNIYWDANNGPSTSYFSQGGSYSSLGVSESFQVYSASATPEPSTLALLGIGTLAAAGYAWKRRKKAA
jgi:hypothetical protein